MLGDAGRERALHLPRRLRLLRPQRPRGRRRRRGAARQGGRQAGARAMVARRRARLGPEGPADADRPARRASTTRATSRPGNRSSSSRSRPPGGFNVPLVAATLAGMPATDRHRARQHLPELGDPLQVRRTCKTVCHRLETTPFRPSWISTPGRMQNTYANECFMDELAAAAKADPIEFRLQVSRSQRQARPRGARAPGRRSPSGRSGPRRSANAAATSCKGRGVTYCKYELVRTYVGVVAEVEVDRTTGEIRVPKFYVVARLRPDHQSGRAEEPDRRQRHPDGEPHADRGAEVRPLAR